jgi:hypothetical protein
MESNSMAYEDYDDRAKLEGVHADEVLGCVKKALGADRVDLIDYVVRRRHPEWPIATGETYAFQQPASRAHIGECLRCRLASASIALIRRELTLVPRLDHTFDGAVAIIKEAHGDEADAVLKGRWQLVK